MPSTPPPTLVPLLGLLAWFVLPNMMSRAATPPPAPPQSRPIALIGGTVHPISGPDIEKGAVVFEGGKITFIGKQAKLPKDCERIDVAGKHVYPGLIASFTHLGLTEVDALRPTNDINESGEINPNVRAERAVNPESELIPVARSNGITLALTVPGGRLLTGMGAWIELDGWSSEQMTFHAPAALHLRWPGGKGEGPQKSLAHLQNAFDDARAYQQAKTAAEQQAAPPPPADLRWEGMLPLLRGEVPLLVSVDDAAGIQDTVAFAARQRVKLIIHGGYDAVECAELLKSQNTPVVISGVHRLPMRRDEPYNHPFTLANRLREAGVTFCIADNDRTGNIRNLPYQAALAAAHGLPADEALKSITLYPAQIFGLADRVGSLDLGKDATLIVTTGDPLDIRSQVELEFIQGRRIDLRDKQKDLYDKYRNKPPAP